MNVFVGCQQGKDRSALIVIAYLISKFDISVDDAIVYVKTRRSIIITIEKKGGGGGGTYYKFLDDDFNA